MADVATLIERLELLADGNPLPGDDKPVPGFGTMRGIRENKAILRTGNQAIYRDRNPVPPRLSCELYDNLDTIMAALRFWRDRKDQPHA